MTAKVQFTVVMKKHTTIPEIDGLYWYFKQGAAEPRPVMIDQAK